MSISLRNGLGTSLLAVAGLAGSAQATYFSFASDNNSSLPTFVGTAGSAGSFNITSPANNTFKLQIDDKNGPNPTLSVNTVLSTNLTASFAGMGGFGTFITWNYAVSGTVDFLDPSTGGLLLRISIASDTPSVLTVPGTPSTWSTAGAIIGSQSFAAGLHYTLSSSGYAAFSTAASNAGVAISQYDVIAPGTSSGPDDFGFTLTVLNQVGGVSVPISTDPQSPNYHLPTAAWQSESSYSGSSGVYIPAPGAAALLGLAGLITTRRRRA